MKIRETAFLATVSMLSSMAFGATFNFSGAYSSDWNDVGNWGGTYPSSGDYAVLNKTANLNSPVPNNIPGFRIGTVGAGTLNIGPDAVLRASANASCESYVGEGEGGNGTLNQSGGTIVVNYLEVGRGNGSRGLVSVEGGEFIICRGKGGHSLYLGTDDSLKIKGGVGTVQISGGLFKTRTGVYLGSADGTSIGSFSVVGAASESIGIGSDSSGSGTWTQNPGSTLKFRIDEDGVTKVFVDEVDGEAAVTFEAGALLDVDFVSGVPHGGTWVVMELENADIVDRGLRFSNNVDPGRWSFKIDNSGENAILTVTAQGKPLGLING